MLLVAVVLFAMERERRTSEAARKKMTFAMIDLNRDVDAANLAMTEFNLDGGLDLAGLEDGARLDNRLALATKAHAATTHVLSVGDAADAELARRIDWPRNRRIYQTHRDAYAAAVAQLAFLKEHAGHWRVDGVGLSVNWDTQSLQAAAAKLAEAVAASRAAQEGLPSPATTQAH